jgi:hypothetical protein
MGRCAACRCTGLFADTISQIDPVPINRVARHPFILAQSPPLGEVVKLLKSIIYMVNFLIKWYIQRL